MNAVPLLHRLLRLTSLPSPISTTLDTVQRAKTPMASALGALATHVSVSDALPDSHDKAGVRPAHHANDTQSKFVNPWPSYR